MEENLYVYIEINGEKRLVGELNGNDYRDICFQYLEEYLSFRGSVPISISLPLQREAFSAEQTRGFFNGLLPEGYTRRCVAAEINAGDDDYIALLKELGSECLGAIQVLENIASDEPLIYEEMSRDLLLAFAREGALRSAELVTKTHLSLTGASGKAGLYLDEKTGKWFLPSGIAPSTHIVKQSHVRLSHIVANEQLCMMTAGKLGIKVPESHILTFSGGDDGNVLFATRRYDRVFTDKTRQSQQGHPIPLRLHQEDFAQALGIQSERKYEKGQDAYLQKMMHLLAARAANPIQDQMVLWKMLVFNYLIGNTDCHIKNYSLLYNETLESVQLAPAYDMLSTVIYENSSEEMAVSINGKYNIYEIIREDFVEEAAKDGLNVRLCMREYDRMRNDFEEKLTESWQELQKLGFEQCQEIGQQILHKFENRHV